MNIRPLRKFSYEEEIVLKLKNVIPHATSSFLTLGRASKPSGRQIVIPRRKKMNIRVDDSTTSTSRLQFIIYSSGVVQVDNLSLQNDCARENPYGGGFGEILNWL